MVALAAVGRVVSSCGRLESQCDFRHILGPCSLAKVEYRGRTIINEERR
jgi:hypothetical protein